MASSAAARSTLANAGSPARRSIKSFAPPCSFTTRGGGLAVAANPLVQVLPIAAGGHGRHQDVFRRHERQFFGQMLGDHLRIDDQPAATF